MQDAEKSAASVVLATSKAVPRREPAEGYASECFRFGCGHADGLFERPANRCLAVADGSRPPVY